MDGVPQATEISVKKEMTKIRERVSRTSKLGIKVKDFKS